MTCPFCNTFLSDDDHRFPHCARRLRAIPQSVMSGSGSGAATATALAYDYSTKETRSEPVIAKPVIAPPSVAEPEAGQQQRLFAMAINAPRVVSISSKSNSSRAAEGKAPPPPVETAKVELRRRRTPRRGVHQAQSSLDFFSDNPQTAPAPKESIICDAPVAPAVLRLQAALTDGGLMILGCIAAGALYRICGGSFAFDRHLLPFALAALLTIPLFYKILWAFGARDSIGMRTAGLQLVDFDGNPPSQRRRYLRLFGSIISLLAAGIGLIWSFVDEDKLTWHDHISETFPTTSTPA